ncbi:MAG: glycosyltransferase family A protein [Planctomycetota bacterium]
MTGRAPLVSIGLPVFNGEAFLDEAIRAVVGQSHEDFELVLADNASTDGTREICERWSADDARIRWARTEAHTGAAHNFNRAFKLARGHYFKWVAHDDLIEPTYLKRCVDVLESDATVVLAHSKMVEIDERSEVLRDLDIHVPGMDDADPVRRFRGAIDLGHGCFDVFGLVRRPALANTKLIAPYLGSDRVLLAELALMGRFHRVPEKLFLSREHPQRSIRMRSERDREKWFATGVPSKNFRPNWKRLAEVRDALRRAEVPPGVRMRAKAVIAEWALRQRGSLLREAIGRGRPDDIREKQPPLAAPTDASGTPLGASESPGAGG